MSLLVSPAWLAARLDDPHTVILDATLPPVGVVPPADTHARYLARHLPGAVFFDIEAFSDPASGLPHALPAAEEFARGMGALGVRETMTVVVYEQEGVFSAPRAVWMLRSSGCGRSTCSTAVSKPGRKPVCPPFPGRSNAHPPSLPPGSTPMPSLISTSCRNSSPPERRSWTRVPPVRFAGTAPEPRPGLPSGHMPGAISVPFTELVEAGRLKQPAELAAIFKEKDVDLSQPITTTCGSGITAAVVSLALELAGAPQVSLYDGSWAEYAAHPQARIVRADPPGAT